MNQLLITDREKIRKEWGKTYSDVEKDIENIQQWLKTQKHLPETPSENMIEFFLTNCKFSIEKTKQNLDMYYTVRTLIPDIYKGNNPCKPLDIEPAYQTGTVCLLPKLTPDLYRVLICKFNDIDPDVSNVTKFSAHMLNNMYEIRIHEDLAMGDICIVDYEFMKLGILAKCTPILLKNSAQIFQKIHSNRLKSLHLLRPPGYVDTVISLFKGFLPKKLQQRVFIHYDVKELYKYIPREILPEEYGGDEKSLNELQGLWKKKFYEYEERFQKLDNMTVNEDLRPEKLENDEILGYHGNFKKISLD